MVAATVLALGSAALHASWNLLVKTSADRLLAAWAQFLAGGLLFLPVVVVVGPPGLDAVPLLVGSVVVHVAYLTALARAYDHGDFSLSYPLARGGGALAAALGGVVLLGDTLSGASWVAIAVVVGGLSSLARSPTERAALSWAGLTALAIGTYTTIDAAGARRSSGLAYATVLALGTAVALGLVLLVGGRGAALRSSIRDGWRRALVGGAASVIAYGMVLAAVRLAPVGYVAALREVSVVLGALAGWLLLGEPFGSRRALAALVVAAGLALLVATS